MSLSQWQKENPTMKQDLQILYDLIQKLKPKKIVEIGAGHSTLAMALALYFSGLDTYIYTTDIDKHRVEIFQKETSETKLNLHIVFNDIDSLKFLSEFDGIADLIFIDSSHKYEQTLSELEEAAGKLAPNGYIIMHDAISMAGVRDAIYRFMEVHKEEFKYFVLKTECGLGVLQRK